MVSKTAQAARVILDPDRGLDQFLAGLASAAYWFRAAARSPGRPEVNLGEVAPGRDRKFTLELMNRGDRLLYGTLRCEDAPWLSVGEIAVGAGLLIQFTHNKTIPVRIVGKRLLAGSKPHEGRLVVETNAGDQTIMVRLEVPVKPFPEGPLAGARTPRQLAEKAKADPKAACHLFESGAVARWYEDNGWIYPGARRRCKRGGGHSSSSSSAGRDQWLVQRWQISDQILRLSAPPFEHTLEVRALEKRAVFATASSDQKWLRVGPVALQGSVARIPLSVPEPPAGGDSARAHVQVTANGNQRFSVTVECTVPRRLQLPPLAKPAPGPIAPVQEVRAAEPKRVSKPAEPPVRVDAAPEHVDFRSTDTPWSALLHLLPLAVLAVILLGFGIRDMLSPDAGAGSKPLTQTVSEDAPWVDEAVEIDPVPHLRFEVHDRPIPRAFLDLPERLALDAAVRQPSRRFGLSLVGPEGGDKRLTYDRWGRSNNTCLRVDDREVLFGDLLQGRWAAPDVANWKVGEGVHRGHRSVFVLKGSPVRVTQTLELIPGRFVRKEGKLVRLLDTCLVRYVITNDDDREHNVGIRFLLDTYIGANDGVPFLFPGEVGGCNTVKVFTGADQVPDYILALEEDNLEAPGTVAKVNLRLGGEEQWPDRVVVGAWPSTKLVFAAGDARCLGALTLWDVPALSMKAIAEAPGVGLLSNPDSAVTIYWSPRALPAGKAREVRFSYGLGSLTSGEAQGSLGLVGDEMIATGQVFLLQALVSRPGPGQVLELKVPEGISLVEGEASQPVPAVPAGAARPLSTVTWRLKGSRPGGQTLTVRSSTGVSQSRMVRIVAPENKDFWNR